MARQLALFGGGKQLMGSPRKLAPFERILELDRTAKKLAAEQGLDLMSAYSAAMAQDAFANAERAPAPSIPPRPAGSTKRAFSPGSPHGTDR